MQVEHLFIMSSVADNVNGNEKINLKDVITKEKTPLYNHTSEMLGGGRVHDNLIYKTDEKGNITKEPRTSLYVRGRFVQFVEGVNPDEPTKRTTILDGVFTPIDEKDPYFDTLMNNAQPFHNGLSKADATAYKAKIGAITSQNKAKAAANTKFEIEKANINTALLNLDAAQTLKALKKIAKDDAGTTRGNIAETMIADLKAPATGTTVVNLTQPAIVDEED